MELALTERHPFESVAPVGRPPLRATLDFITKMAAPIVLSASASASALIPSGFIHITGNLHLPKSM